MINQELFGKIVQADHRLVRKTGNRRTEHGSRLITKYWEKKHFVMPKDVMIIGVRTLSNGTCDWGYEEGPLYDPDVYFKALLVVSDLYKKPFCIEYKSF